jgi:hypothetical protein
MTKRAIYLFLFGILTVLAVSCKHSYTENKTILKAEQFLFTYPDSAFLLLKSIKNPENLSQADYAAWCLHYTHAQYKLYLDIKSDSLIKIAINYYDNTSFYINSGTSFYLLGCISELKKDKKKAMLCYKNADNILSNEKKSMPQQIKIKGLINYRISNLYLNDEYYSDAEININIAIRYFETMKDNRYLAYCHRTKAEIYYRQEKPNALVIKEAEISKKFAINDSNNDLYNEILVFQGKLLVSSDLIESKNTLLTALKSSSDNQDLYSLLTYVYAKLNNTDSAKYYKSYVALDQEDLNRMLLLQLSESYIYLNEDSKEMAFMNYENAYNLRERIYKENIKEQLIRIDKQYDLSKKEAEKAKLEIQNQKNIILIAFLSITVLAVLLILLFITNINKKRQAALIIEKQQLEFEVKTKQVENDKKLKILHSNLQNKIDNTLQFKKLQTNFSKAERKEEFIADITRQSVLTNVEWQFYIYEANELFEGKILKLREQYPQLTDADMNVIALICLGIDIGNSIILLDYSSFNTMYIRRNRIKNHLGLDKNTDLEKWLNEFIKVEEQI